MRRDVQNTPKIASVNKIPRRKSVLDNDALRAQAAIYLGCGMSDSEAARTLKIDRHTLALWRKDPAFERSVAGERSAFLRGIKASLFSLGETAVATLQAVMRGDNDAARCRAALAVIELLGAKPDRIIDGAGGKVIKIRFTNPSNGNSASNA